MNKKAMKILSVMLIMMMSVTMIGSTVFAFAPNEVVGSKNVTGQDQIKSIGQDLVGILQTVGIVLSVVILIVLGIKYMMGSASEKAEYKKTMIPYLIGALLIFAASVLANVVYQFFNSVK